jgi:tetratricopeptide (TPR) repeat protein
MHRSRVIPSCLLAIFALPLLCFAQTEPQTSAAPLPRNTSSAISARELRIPAKARESFNRGTKLLAEKNSAASIPEFQRAIKAFPDFYEAYYKIGIAELNLQHQRDAQAAFEKSIELSQGRYPPPHFGLGVALCLQQQFPDAEGAIRGGLDLDPADAEGYFTLAWVLFNAARVPDAEKNARQAILLSANFAAAYLLLAQIHLRQGDTSALVSDLDAYIKLDPNDPLSTEAIAVRTQAQQLLAKQRTSVPVVAKTPNP